MTQQSSRLLLVAVILVVGLVTARHFLVPKTFGQRGHFRAAAVDAIEKLPIRYAGREACAMCHAEIVAIHNKARHQTVACEVCHGPAAAHTESPGEIKPPAPTHPRLLPALPRLRPHAPHRFPADRSGIAQSGKSLHQLPQSARPGTPARAGRVRRLPRADRALQGRFAPRPIGLHAVPHHPAKAQGHAPPGASGKAAHPRILRRLPRPGRAQLQGDSAH